MLFKILTPSEINTNWDKLTRLVSGTGLAKVLKHFEHDLVWADNGWIPTNAEFSDKGCYLNQVFAGLKNAPAGKFNHHAYPGGLVEHYLEMWSIHEKLGYDFPESEVVEAIILHDLHKGSFTFRWPTREESSKLKPGQWFEYGDHPNTKLVDNNSQTLLMMSTCNTCPSNTLVANSLLSSEGGYNKNPPKWVSAFAKYIYCLDELSSNVSARLEKGNHLDVFNIIDTKGLTYL
jgi:hypothetical protein